MNHNNKPIFTKNKATNQQNNTNTSTTDNFMKKYKSQDVFTITKKIFNPLILSSSKNTKKDRDRLNNSPQHIASSTRAIPLSPVNQNHLTQDNNINLSLNRSNTIKEKEITPIKNKINNKKNIGKDQSIQELDTENNNSEDYDYDLGDTDEMKSSQIIKNFYTNSIGEAGAESSQTLINNLPKPFVKANQQPVNRKKSPSPDKTESKYHKAIRTFFSCAKKGDREEFLNCLEIILSTKKQDINIQDESGWTALHYASDEGNVKIVEILIKADADLNIKTNKKQTPLHISTIRGYFDVSKLLIDNGCIINALDNEKNTPVHICAENGHLELLSYLLARCPEADAKNIYFKTPLDLAKNDRVKECLEEYLNKKNTHYQKVHIHTTNNKSADKLLQKFQANYTKTKQPSISAKHVKNQSNAFLSKNVNNNLNTNSSNNGNNTTTTTTSTQFKNINININSSPFQGATSTTNKIIIKEKVKVTVETSPKIKTKKDVAGNSSSSGRVLSRKDTPTSMNMTATNSTGLFKLKSNKLFNTEKFSKKNDMKVNNMPNNSSSERKHHLNNTTGKKNLMSPIPTTVETSPWSTTKEKVKDKNSGVNSNNNKEIQYSNSNAKEKDEQIIHYIDNNEDDNCEIDDIEDINENKYDNNYDEEDDEEEETDEEEDEYENSGDSVKYIDITSTKLINDSNDNSDVNSYENNSNSNTHSISQDEEKVGPSAFICHALLGKGSFGEVYLVEHKLSKALYAMKVLSKDKIMGQNLVKYALTERNVLSFTNNPFIVKLNAAFQTSDKLFLILDYCPGGDLAEHLGRENRFTEERAKIYLCEIVLALEDLHKRDIIYRDLKPDNVVLDEDGHALLTDFGLSKEGVLDHKGAKSFCGSIAYLAPEMLKRTGHGKAVDWYLLGVLFFEMLVGIPPFFTNNKEQLFRNIERADLQIPSFVSSGAADLLRALLNRDTMKRLGSGKDDAEEIKSHAYFNDINWDDVFNRKLKPPIPPFKHKALQHFTRPREFPHDINNSAYPHNHLDGWSFINSN